MEEITLRYEANDDTFLIGGRDFEDTDVDTGGVVHISEGTSMIVSSLFVIDGLLDLDGYLTVE